MSNYVYRPVTDQPPPRTAPSNETRFFLFFNASSGHLELKCHRTVDDVITVAQLNCNSGCIDLIANGADGSGSLLQRNASGYVKVTQGGGTPIND